MEVLEKQYPISPRLFTGKEVTELNIAQEFPDT